MRKLNIALLEYIQAGKSAHDILMKSQNSSSDLA